MESFPESAGRRLQAAAVVRGAIECVVIVLVVLAPWPLGSVHPAFEALLYAGVAGLLLLWGARILLEGRLTWRRCPVVVCLAGLFLFGVLQLVPLPHGVLSRLSPATVRLCDKLLPAQRETLPEGDIPQAPLAAEDRLSLYPGGTREELVRLLGVFLLFVAVRHNAASPKALGRLAVAATVNGAALALFAFLQFFSSSHQTIYWGLPVPQGSPFGPFICRNHFPFYVNMCIGLAVGLLLARRRGSDASADSREREYGAGASWNPFALLHDPPSLWITAALALMLAGVAFSLSRGGLVALTCACGLCLVFRSAVASRPGRWAGTLLSVGLALGLLAWLGTGPLRERLSTLWEGDLLQEGRSEIWADVVPAAKDYPLFGTGYGTFEHIELIYRKSPAHQGWVVEHAHNDYLEALVEGGAVRLLLSVAAILFVYRLGWRALRRYRGRSTGGLVLGALLGFTTVVVHSAVDFGLHIPAIAVLTAVVAAQLAGVGEKRPMPEGVEPLAPTALSWGTRALATAGGATAFMLALLLCAEGWRLAEGESLRLSARSRADDEGLRLLEAATAITPERADLHREAGQAYLARYDQQVARATGADERQRATRQYLWPGLAHYVRARDLCPLSAKLHLRLAAHRDEFERADTRDTYVERAERLLPSDPELHYLAGNLELAGGERESALRSWRQSLALSDAYQKAIVEQARSVLTDEELLDQVLPDRPQQIYAAAAQLYPDSGAAGRRPFCEKALRLLCRPGAAQSPTDFHLKAVLHAACDQPELAAAAYEAALDRTPLETEWRCEFAGLLYRQGRLREARRQLLAVLADQPDHREGERLLRAVAKDMAERN